MGFIADVMHINNDINFQYQQMDSKKIKIPFITNHIYERNLKKLRKTIDSLPNNILTMELVGEFADFILLEDYTKYGFYYKIKQLMKGRDDMAGSITFDLDLPDYYGATITVNFIKDSLNKDGIKYHKAGDCTYCIYGPNSSSRFIYTEKNVEVFDVSGKEKFLDMENISSTNTGKLYQAEKVFIEETYSCIKEFLNSNIGMRKLNG